MKIYPALKTAALLAIGISFACWYRLPAIWLTFLTLLLLSLSILFDRSRAGQIYLVAAIITAASLSFRPSDLVESFDPALLTISGTVAEPPHKYDNWVSFPVGIERMEDENGVIVSDPGKVWVRLMSRDRRIEPGVTVQFSGLLTPTYPGRNPGDFDLKSWRLRNGFIGEMFMQSGDSIIITGKDLSITHRIRTSIQRRINSYFRGDAPLISAVMLGIRRDLDEDMVDSMRKAGLSHLLALSGLHIGFLTAILFAVAALLRLPFKLRIVFVLISLALFAMIVPPRSSTIRATIMAATFLMGPLFRQQSPPANSLGVAALLILCFRPGELFDVGFQLSFAAVGGILLFRPLIDPLISAFRRNSNRLGRTVARYILYPFLLSLSVTLLVLPLTSVHFGTLAYGAPLFNVIAVPLLAIIYAGSWVVVLLSTVSSNVAGLAADGMYVLLSLWSTVIHTFGNYAPLLNLKFSPFIAVTLLSGIICVRFIERQRQLILLLFLLTIFVLDGLLPRPSRFQAWFLDVGHGDAAVWRFPSGKVAVIDGGPDRKGNSVGWVVQMLRHFNHREIDLLIATHPEFDHIGGLYEIISEYKVNTAIASPKLSMTHTYTRLCSLSTAKGLFWYKAIAGTKISGFSEEYDLNVLGPPIGTDNWSSNDASVVLKLSIESEDGSPLRLLTAGDIEKRGETALLESHDVQAELYKASHHGSKTSNSYELIDAINPKDVVISRGRSDRYGSKLSPDLIRTLLNRSIGLHISGSEGAILFEPHFTQDRAVWRKVDWRKPNFIRWLFRV